MYFGKRTHLLSYSIMASALVRLVGALTEGILRTVIKSSNIFVPGMMDTVLWRIQLGISISEIIAISLIFIHFQKKLRRYEGLLPEEEHEELGRLQKEYLGGHLPTLTASEVGQLLQMWGVILIGAESIYCVTSSIYRKFIMHLMLLVMSGGQYAYFAPVYNMTHGFKYLEILTAILFGIVMTGILLKDRHLEIAALIIAVFFLLSFGIFQMQTLNFSGKDVGIVWTSVIFHLTETLGLFLLSVYLSKHYSGL